jgi:hypothetical protein
MIREVRLLLLSVRATEHKAKFKCATVLIPEVLPVLFRPLPTKVLPPSSQAANDQSFHILPVEREYV